MSPISLPTAVLKQCNEIYMYAHTYSGIYTRTLRKWRIMKGITAFVAFSSIMTSGRCLLGTSGAVATEWCVVVCAQWQLNGLESLPTAPRECGELIAYTNTSTLQSKILNSCPKL